MKTLETVAFIAAAVGVAVFAPEFLPALIPGISALGIAAATAAIEIGISLAANQLIGPAVPKGLAGQVNNQVQRLFVTMDTTAPRKIVFGTTAGATDLRYQEYTGTNQRYYEQIIAVASHQVNSIYEIWFDNEKAWTSAGGVQGRFSGFLTVDVRNVGTSANGIAISSTWTSACTLTGCAYIHLKFDLLGSAATGGTNNSPFASGVTSRVTIRTNGALIYDPRLDSTVAGGSGTQRAATQSTWAWDANASRNPALQLLWYLLGWQINGKLAVGMGLPAARIDLASFAVAANACDASITLNGGGSEPRYRADGVISEGDDRSSVIESLCAAMNAVLRDAGGKLALTVLSNDLASPVASFTEADILGSEQWDQTPALSSTFNICRGRRVDPSDNALYQLVDVPEASLTSNDGINRIDTMDMPFVSSNGQAQRLLKQRLQRKQYQGKYTLIGNARWWQTSLGNVIQLTHAGLGWSSKLFRVAGQSISRDGTTKMTLIEENAAIYAWSNSEAAAVTAGAPTIYDPANTPLGVANAKLGGIASGATVGGVIGPGGNITGAVDANGRAIVDFSSPNLNQNAQHLPYGDGTPVESLKPAQAGADVTSSNAAVGDANRVRFSLMEKGAQGYALLSNPASLVGSTGVATVGGRQAFFGNFAWTAANQFFDIGTTFGASAKERIPVTAGERIFAGARVNFTPGTPAGSTWQLLLNYYDSSGTYLSTSAALASGSTDPGGARQGQFVTVPASATTCILFARASNATSGAASATIEISEPQVCSAGATQTAFPAFSRGEGSEAGSTLGATAGPGGNLGGDVDANLRPHIDFTVAGHIGQTIDNIGDGATYGSLPLANISGTGTTKRALIDHSQAHLNKLTSVFTDDAKLGVTSVVIDPFADIIIAADSTGTIKTGELPRNVQLTASVGTSSVTTAGTWSVTAVTGVTCAIGASTGILSITAMTVSEAFIPISFVYGGVTRTAVLHVVVQSDPPTNGSSGSSGTPATTTALGVTTGTVYDTTNATSPTLSVAAGATGTVSLSAPIGYKRNSTAAGRTGAAGKWQWRVVGGTFADVATEVSDTADFAETDTSPVTNYQGSLSVSQSKTGLTSGTTYEFRFLWREVAISGSPAHLYRVNGTMSATGS